MVHRGVPAQEAQRYVSRSVLAWFNERLLVLDAPGHEGSGGCAVRQIVRVPGLTASLRYSGGAVARVVGPVFRHLESEEGGCDVRLDVVESGDLVFVVQDGRVVAICPLPEAAATVKGLLMETLLGTAGAHVAVHAACLVREGRALLVCGRPGAGKTTLTLALVAAGFDYAGDDIALLGPDRLARGVAFAPALKAGSWKLVEPFRADLRTHRVHRRPDGRRVRYLSPERLRTEALPVGWALFIERDPARPAGLREVEPTQALSRLLDGASSPGGTLTRAGLAAVAHAVGTAARLELTYSDLAGAVSLVEDVCRGR